MPATAAALRAGALSAKPVETLGRFFMCSTRACCCGAVEDVAVPDGKGRCVALAARLPAGRRRSQEAERLGDGGKRRPPIFKPRHEQRLPRRANRPSLPPWQPFPRPPQWSHLP